MNISTKGEEQTTDAPVFERLGTIIRSLHDALRELGAEQVLADAAIEFPSARERLLHIGQLTEKAANTVLGKVEETGPIQDRLAGSAENLGAAWTDGPILSLVPESLKPLVEQTKGFMIQVQDGCSTTRAALSDMMMAQDFQDLTGQLIKKVVSVLEHTENDLLKLLIDAAPPGTISRVKKDEIMAGPGTPGGVTLEQAAVDDLLADLGF
jgi:chemotaxis protein CheZ